MRLILNKFENPKYYDETQIYNFKWMFFSFNFSIKNVLIFDYQFFSMFCTSFAVISKIWTKNRQNFLFKTGFEVDFYYHIKLIEVYISKKNIVKKSMTLKNSKKIAPISHWNPEILIKNGFSIIYFIHYLFTKIFSKLTCKYVLFILYEYEKAEMNIVCMIKQLIFCMSGVI